MACAAAPVIFLGTITPKATGAVSSSLTLFKRLSLMYFAAASYAEAARRLDKPELAPGFLLHGHPAFGGELRTCAALAAQAPRGAARALLMDRIDRAVEPFDIVGLLRYAPAGSMPIAGRTTSTHQSSLSQRTTSAL